MDCLGIKQGILSLLKLLENELIPFTIDRVHRYLQVENKEYSK